MELFDTHAFCLVWWSISCFRPENVSYKYNWYVFTLEWVFWKEFRYTGKKLEVDLTKDGSPQLQDLGQYHLPCTFTTV